MPPSTRDAHDAFLRVLGERGVREALAYLLGLTDFRYIGLFRFQDGMATAAVHYDREAPGELRSAVVPETATYCCYVRDSGGAFTTANALLDPRLETHPARAAVLAYSGVPVLSPEGEILGTLCHYDLVPRDPAQIDLDLMLQAASTLAYGGHVPAYPAEKPAPEGASPPGAGAGAGADAGDGGDRSASRTHSSRS